jgi:shikimate kinase
VVERISLIGYRGTGKSTVAQMLADRLGWTWCDADQVLDEQFGRSIRQIFATEGESGFRDKESVILRDLATRRHCVIATGGGVVLRPENCEYLRSGVTIWLTADPQTIWQRMQADATTAERRPDLAQGGLPEIEGLLRIRAPLYKACSDWLVDTTNQTPQQVAGRIIAWLKGRGGVDILEA